MRFHQQRFIKFGIFAFVLVLFSNVTLSATAQAALTYPIVDTNQTYCFSDTGVITCGQSFNGQDAQYTGLQPAYQNNGDGTITDLNTGLMWIQDPGSKTTFDAANQLLQSYIFAGYDDWRLPTIKELYSLMQFSGMDVSSAQSVTDDMIPFMDTDYFNFQYGDTSAGNRVIDSQWLTSTVYNSTVMGGNQCFFGVNFADGRIKCYPTNSRNDGYFALFVRGTGYGVNSFVDNGDGTITDQATSLTWMQGDSGAGLTWGDSLQYCEALSLGGADDWRLPNIKELHSIVDYTRSPDVTGSAAIDPLFATSSITNEAGQADFPYYWSSTTHMTYVGTVNHADYISFGRALGNMEEFGGWIDVHGAGAQRSDPKTSVPADEVNGHGPQGDARRALNYVRCVRGGVANASSGDDPSTLNLPSGGSQQPQGNGQPQGQEGGQPQGQNGGQPQGQNGGQEIPQQAIDACAGLSDGASCSLQTPNGTLSGVCRSMNSTLGCVPNN